MSATSLALIDTLPQLLVLLRRDGTLLAHLGGHGMEALVPTSATGTDIAAGWPETLAALAKRLTRRAIELRGTLDAEFHVAGIDYELRVGAQGPDRALCIVRHATSMLSLGRGGAASAPHAKHLDRRGFLRRLRASLAQSSLNERPLAVATIFVDGLLDLSRIMDAKVAEQAVGEALERLPDASDPGSFEPAWYIGQLSENLLVVVVESASRELIERRVRHICDGIGAPIQVGDATFHLRPFAGAAILGRDADSPAALLDHSRASAMEARRAGSGHIQFFSDTLKLRSFARLDVARELEAAIANREIRLRYVGRHDLKSGRQTAWVGYLQWLHPLRGEVRPAEFLPVAEATGQAMALSRSILARLGEDFELFRSQTDSSVRMSFGAVRHHVLAEGFLTDIESFLCEGPVPADRLELRIAERAYVAREAPVWRGLADRGVQLVVDELGRDVSSLELLARAPIAALQLDRSWVTAMDGDADAARVCQAAISLAAGLGIRSIAAGVDHQVRRAQLVNMGCSEGLGDLFEGSSVPIPLTGVDTAPRTGRSAAG